MSYMTSMTSYFPYITVILRPNKWWWWWWWLFATTNSVDDFWLRSKKLSHDDSVFLSVCKRNLIGVIYTLDAQANSAFHPFGVGKRVAIRTR